MYERVKNIVILTHRVYKKNCYIKLYFLKILNRKIL